MFRAVFCWFAGSHLNRIPVRVSPQRKNILRASYFAAMTSYDGSSYRFNSESSADRIMPDVYDHVGPTSSLS